MLHDQRLGAKQAEAWRVGAAKICTGCEFAGVETPLRIDTRLVVAKGHRFGVGQELELRNSDAVLAGDDTAQIARQLHDLGDDDVGPPQHLVVIGIDRDVGMDVAIARMHVQCNEQPALEHLAVQCRDPVDHRFIGRPGEQAGQRLADLALPRQPDYPLLQQIDQARLAVQVGTPCELDLEATLLAGYQRAAESRER